MYRTASLLAILAAAFLTGCQSPAPRVVERERVVLLQAPRAEGLGDSLPAAPTSSAPASRSTAPTSAASPQSASLATQQAASYFYDALTPYGRWIDVQDYGPCWQPYNCPPDWRPYTVGHWAYADDYGWLWASVEPFGWCCYHYGRWAFVVGLGWCWVPGSVWGPAWVVWRYGGGYVGWAPLPPAPSTTAIQIVIEALPPWCYVFVEERYLAEFNLREHIVPVTRNVTLLHITRNVTRYEIVNGRWVNHGVDVRRIETAAGKPIPRFRVTDAAAPRLAGARGNEIIVHRPQVPARPPLNPPPPRFVPIPQPRELPTAIDTQHRLIEQYYDELQNEMARRHQRELQQLPPARPREPVLLQQLDEWRAFEEQRRRALEPIYAHPKVLRRT